MQAADLADDQQRRAGQVLTDLGQLCQRCQHHLLLRRAAGADQCRRQIGGETQCQQALADACAQRQAHIEHQGLRTGFEMRPIRLRLAGLQTRSEKLHTVSQAAMGQRYAGRRGAAGGSGHAGHHPKGHAGGRQRQQLFPATAEDEGITALEAYHQATTPRLAHQQCVDRLLRQAVLAARLAGKQPFGGGWDLGQDLCRHQLVVDHQFGLLQQAPRFAGQQFGIAGAGTD